MSAEGDLRPCVPLVTAVSDGEGTSMWKLSRDCIRKGLTAMAAAACGESPVEDGDIACWGWTQKSEVAAVSRL